MAFNDSLKSLIFEQIFQLLPMMIFLGILLILGKIFQDKVVNYIQKFWKKIKNSDDHYLDAHTLSIISTVNEELSQLRNDMNADRAFIYHFHNGTVFTPTYPSWKMSNTYLKVGKGISNDRKNLQNIEISLRWDDYLKSLWLSKNDTYPEGNYILDTNLSCGLKSCEDPRKVIMIKVDELVYSHDARIEFEDMGIYALLITPILDAKRKYPIGFVGVDYTDKDEFEKILNDKNFQPCQLCKFSAQLSSYFLLTNTNEVKFINASRKFAEITDRI